MSNADIALTKFDRHALRNAFGQFPTGVTIITSQRDGQIRGMTANSFTSVSLEPALLLVSIGHYAKMPDVIRESGKFGLSVLGRDQEDISQHFASAGSERTVVFDTLATVPVIPRSVATFACAFHSEHVAGDHSLFVGEILDFTVQSGAPLLFHSGQYRSIAACDIAHR